MTADLQTALGLAEHGFRVFPLKPNTKVPAIKKWPVRATTDAKIIKKWWTDTVMNWPVPWGVGIATGQGLVVIDLDVKHNGEASFKLLEFVNGRLPPSLQVKTPSGGRHLYFRASEPFGNSASALAAGVDTRGEGGYVVGPGTIINGTAYKTDGGDLGAGAEALSDLPTSWAALLRGTATARDKGSSDSATPVSDMDTPQAIERAVEWLTTDAKIAVEGGGGDAETYAVAAKMKDFGVSEGKTLNLMLDHWNGRCAPPWDPDDLAVKVGNAYAYGTSPPGAANPQADFGPVRIDEGKHPLKPRPATGQSTLQAPAPVLGLGHLDIKPRPWLIENFLLRRKVAELVAPGGVGKSTFTLALALAVATGRSDIVGFPIQESGPVWIYNNEDDADELHLRLAALMRHHNISDTDLVEKNGRPLLFVNSGESGPLTIATKKGERVEPRDRDGLIRFIREHGIMFFIADPLVETHNASENSNEDMSAVLRMYRNVAQKGDCVTFVVHHTRKPPQGPSDGHAGNMDSGRGASSVPNTVRTFATLYPMSKNDAKAHAIPDQDRNRYIHLDIGKMNMALLTGRPKWYELVSVDVPYGDDPLDVESVGIAVPAAIEDRRDDVAKAEEEQAAVIAEAAVSFVPSMQGCAVDAGPRGTLSQIAGRLISERPDLVQGSLNTVIGKLERVFSPPREVNGFLWACSSNEKVPGSNARRWLVRREAATSEENQNVKTDA